MAMKLDESFVTRGLSEHPDAAHYINTLAEEVRRLEGLVDRYEFALRVIADLRNAPSIARCALFPERPEVLARRLGPTVAEQLEIARLAETEAVAVRLDTAEADDTQMKEEP